jgi:hypothetical protein
MKKARRHLVGQAGRDRFLVFCVLVPLVALFALATHNGSSRATADQQVYPRTVTGGTLAARSPRSQSAIGEVIFTKQVIGTGVLETHAVVAADLDGDGDLDVAATDYVNGVVNWYENDGGGGFIPRVLDADLEGAYPISVGDVDGDGKVDVLAAGYLGGLFVWYRNEGGGNFTRFVVDDAADGPHSIVTIDLDGDGDMDLVTTWQGGTHRSGNLVAWYENDGNQNFTRHIIDDEAIDAKDAKAADINGDGHLDVVAGSFSSNEVAWYENDGDQNFTKHVIDEEALGAYYVSLAEP